LTYEILYQNPQGLNQQELAQGLGVTVNETIASLYYLIERNLIIREGTVGRPRYKLVNRS
jgi:hypothetical protein